MAAGAAALPVLTRSASALDYPTRPVRIVVGSTPGSASDIVARLTAHWLSERLGQQFIVENRPGAGDNIATGFVARAQPDGYTLLYVIPPNAINATLYPTLDFNFLRDIAPIAGIIRTPSVMEVNLSVPTKTVPEFIAYAKANPGKINMATAGPGTGQHLFGELFKMMAGVDLLPVHYHGAQQALTDLIGDRVQVMFDIVPASLGYIRAGKLRALGVTTSSQIEALPGVPPIGDFVPRYEASGWQGIGAPSNTPTEIVAKLNKEVNAALSDAQFKARLADLGGQAFPGSPPDFGKFLAGETEKWGKVIRAANIKPE
ncbi:MAG TPA: tripartite tricarboxylate transporter substrate binding protein [Lacipirellulaceae bacterium]|nr:tripartite tricarboxylate transporter substrate binding protein [Lacipirellulaceae bacterium]